MSTSQVLVPASLVSQFLANEKIASRHWLQCQMECLLDQVFDQLSTKFEDYLASNAITDTAHHTTIEGDAIQHEPPFQVHSRPQFPQFQATTDPLIDSELPVAFEQFQNGGHREDDQVDQDGIYSSKSHENHDPQTICDQSQNPPSLSVSTSNLELLNQNDANEEYCLGVGDGQSQVDYIGDAAARMNSDEPEAKTEYDDTNNQLITTDKMSISSLSAPASNEQSNHTNADDENEEEEDCDCDDCRIEVKDEEDNDDDDVQIIENNDGPTLPIKRPRVDTIQPNSQQSLILRQSSIDQSDYGETEPTEEADEVNKVNNQEKLFITLRRQCHQNDCPLMFNNKTELNLHMRTQHNILPFRCFVKDCKQSFCTQDNLSGHFKQVHSHTTQWHCDKCAKHYSTYRLLSTHNNQYHLLGQYKCAYPDCSFTGAYKQQVYDHYTFLHKVEITCHHPDCGRRFKRTSDFKRHQQAHLGIKPYRCKWPSCDFAATVCGNTIAHIKRMHLTQHSQTTDQQSQVDPREYLEVLPDLL